MLEKTGTRRGAAGAGLPFELLIQKIFFAL
jgi:hypothetical protein